MLLQLLFSLFGWLSATRILEFWKKRKVILPQQLQVLRWLQLFLFLPPIFFGGQHALLCWIYLVFLNLAALLLPNLVEISRKREFRRNLLPAVDALLMSVRSGRSFRESLQTVGQKRLYGYYFSEICSLVVLRQSQGLVSSDALTKRVFIELLRIDFTTHKIAERLKSFRHSLKVEESFRQKSSLMTLQARAQSIILSLMYVSVFAYVSCCFGLRENMTAVTVSSALFLVGTIWIWRIGRRHRWKV